MVMWTDLTWVSPSLVRLAARASEDGPVPSSEAMMRMGWVVSLGASEGMSQAAALARSSLARRFGGAVGEGGHAVGGEAFGDLGDGGFLLVGLDGGEGAAGHVGGGDEDYGFDVGVFGVVGGDDGGDHAAHGVSGEDDASGVGAEVDGVGGVAEVGDGGVDVFDGVGEGEVAGAAPGAAVVEEEDVVAGAAEGLGEVEILLVAGEAVEEEDYGVRACSGGDVDEGVEEGAVAGELEGFDGGGIGRGVCGIGGDGSRGLGRGGKSCEERCAEKGC